MKSSNHFFNFLVLALLAALILPSQLCFAATGICLYPLGDINQDKVVDWTDLGLMADQWLQSSGTADLDNSGNIDLIDYALLAADWGATGNCAPVVNAWMDQEITLPANADLSSASVTDDGLPNPPAAVTTQWTQQSGPGTVTFGDASVVATTASFSVDGVYVLRLTANDGDMTAYDELTVTVNPATSNNLPPEVNAGQDQTIYLPNDADLCSASVTDDGMPNPPAAVTQQWSVVSGPNTVTFADANAVCTTASFAGPGVYVLRLTANDSELSASDDVEITVLPNDAPVVNAGSDQTIGYANLTVNLSGSATDDGMPNPPGAVTTLWTVESGSGTVTFGDATSAVTTATFPSTGGTFVLRLTANDGLANGYDELTITVLGIPVWGETGNYYVDGRSNCGSDLNAGTSIAPFATITKALSVVGGGKVLIWGGCTYNEALSLTSSGTTLKRPAACSSQAIINGGGSNVIDSAKGPCTIDGLTLTGGSSGVHLLNQLATGWTIKNCRITGNTGTYPGVYLQKAPNNTVNNCAIYANSGPGIYVTGVSSTPGTGNIVTQCTVYANGSIGVQTNVGPASITTLRDCIITGQTTAIKNGTSSCTLSPITYCDVVGSVTNTSTSTGCITSNPLLVDPGNGDFHLGSGSPAHNHSSTGGDMGYLYSTSAL